MNEQKQGFNTQTYDNPSEAFLASVMANAGVNWPRKNLSGKPKMGKGKGRGRGRMSKKRSA
jgi:hypothetical protein